MKLIRTARTWQAVEVASDGDTVTTVGGTPLKVSNAEATRLEKAAGEAGVSVVVTDADGDDETKYEGSSLQPSPDLSAGVSAVTGTGDPVTSTVVIDKAAGTGQKERS